MWIDWMALDQKWDSQLIRKGGYVSEYKSGGLSERIGEKELK